MNTPQRSFVLTPVPLPESWDATYRGFTLRVRPIPPSEFSVVVKTLEGNPRACFLHFRSALGALWYGRRWVDLLSGYAPK